MRISGFQKLTLLDFPGKTACTVFTPGCNLRCPFCHNSTLVLNPTKDQDICEEEIISYIIKRKGLIDGVCITGGEPMLMKDLPVFCQRLRKTGVAIKIDTNGFFPSQLQYIVNNGLCDYVAMDVKNTLQKYADTIGLPSVDVSKPYESIEFLKSSSIPHEFRTTVCKPFHNKDDIISIATLLGPYESYFLQSFVDSGALIGEGISGYSPSEMREIFNEVKKIVSKAGLRGVDA